MKTETVDLSKLEAGRQPTKKIKNFFIAHFQKMKFSKTFQVLDFFFFFQFP